MLALSTSRPDRDVARGTSHGARLSGCVNNLRAVEHDIQRPRLSRPSVRFATMGGRPHGERTHGGYGRGHSSAQQDSENGKAVETKPQ
jgi:hypothetical protein